MISGIIPNLEMDKSICSNELLLRSSDDVDGEIHKWDHLVNRPDNQGSTGTCEARAECGRAEVLINSSLGDQFAGDKQIDAISVYKRAHEIRYPGKKVNYNSGLQLGDSLQACIELGIYPKDTKITRIKVLPYDVAEALKIGPIVVAQNVHDGWKPGNVNQFTGEIANAPVLGIAGHAVLAIGINLGEQGTVLVTLST